MDELSAAYTELVVEAEKIAREKVWVSSGNMPDQLNAMLGLLWLKIKQLELNKP
jgi:translation initiation factor IF-2